MSDNDVRNIGAVSMEGIFNLQGLLLLDNKVPDNNNTKKTVLALVLIHASWNRSIIQTIDDSSLMLLSPLFTKITKHNHDDNEIDSDTDTVYLVGHVQVDQSDEALACCLGDDDYCNNNDDNDCEEKEHPCPPDHLPVLAVAVHTHTQKHAWLEYISDISSAQIVKHLRLMKQNINDWPIMDTWVPKIQSSLSQLLSNIKNGTKRQTMRKKRSNPTLQSSSDNNGTDAVRIFVAGDRSSVGKSSVCLGILGNLVQQFGYDPSSLAYIKPATQCESPQLIQAYCESIGIACVPVGPLVYFKGFTRAFLAGETGQTSEHLLETCGQAVDDIARGKKVVLVDGVGFPAVGSICGTDNASVSKACGYPSSNSSTHATTKQRHPMGVILVGGSGVGAAVDSFNLNATYFEMANVPVLGGIFNKLSIEGYYSLDNCKQQVTSYFEQNEHNKTLGRIPFGFIPTFDGLGGENAMTRVDEFIKLFGDHVDIQAILDRAQRTKQQQAMMQDSTAAMEIDSPTIDASAEQRAASQQDLSSPPKKRLKGGGGVSQNISHGKGRVGLSRKEIEQLASRQGAAPMA